MSAAHGGVPPHVAPTIRLVTFGVGDVWYAAEISHVERVLRHEDVRPVPNMPAWMDGVLEHQGRFIPVINLRARFGVAPRPLGATLPRDESMGAGRGSGGRLLVMSLGGDVVAAAVDRVVDVRAVVASDIVPPPALVRGVAGDLLKGMVRRDSWVVYVLDVPRLLSSDEHRLLDARRASSTDGGAPLDGAPLDGAPFVGDDATDMCADAHPDAAAAAAGPCPDA